MTRNYSSIIYIVLFLILLAGKKEGRYLKADILSKTLFYPFINAVNWVESQQDLKRSNWMLTNQIGNYIQKINRLETELEYYENQKLDYYHGEYGFVISKIIGSSGNYGQFQYVLNKGFLDGIRKDMPVLGTSGIVGKIVSTGLNYSLLMPLNNRLFKSGVMLKRNNLQGLLEADLKGDVFMNMVRMGSEISLGDTVVTSNLSQLFPANYPVGTISSLRQNVDKVNISAEINPFNDIRSLTTVIVLLYKNQENYIEELEIENESEY